MVADRRVALSLTSDRLRSALSPFSFSFFFLWMAFSLFFPSFSGLKSVREQLDVGNRKSRRSSETNVPFRLGRRRLFFSQLRRPPRLFLWTHIFPFLMTGL